MLGLRAPRASAAALGLAVWVALCVACVACSDTHPGPASAGASDDRGDRGADGSASADTAAGDSGVADDAGLDRDDPAVVDAPGDGRDVSAGDLLADDPANDRADAVGDTEAASDDSAADALDSGDAAACPVEPMDVLYEGFLPTNPYAQAPSATDCVAGEHDVIIVLGCPNLDSGEPAACQTARADIAVELMRAGYGQRFITTGGAVHNAYVEAETLASLLVERGVAAERIRIEDQAEHTDENIYFSSQIMLAEGWRSAMVVSDDPGHLIMTAVCDSNCCVELGRLTVFEFPVEGGQQMAGHYVLYPDAEPVSSGECTHIQLPTKLMCLNLDERRACRSDFQL